MVNVRENQRVLNKALNLVLAVNLNGEKELLGMWIAQTEGAKAGCGYPYFPSLFGRMSEEK